MLAFLAHLSHWGKKKGSMRSFDPSDQALRRAYTSRMCNVFKKFLKNGSSVPLNVCVSISEIEADVTPFCSCKLFTQVF